MNTHHIVLRWKKKMKDSNVILPNDCHADYMQYSFPIFSRILKGHVNQCDLTKQLQEKTVGFVVWRIKLVMPRSASQSSWSQESVCLEFHICRQRQVRGKLALSWLPSFPHFIYIYSGTPAHKMVPLTFRVCIP